MIKCHSNLNATCYEFYKESKKRFDSDPNFKERSQKAVVRLHVIFFIKKNFCSLWTEVNLSDNAKSNITIKILNI